MLSTRVKNYCIVMLRGTMHSMCNTRIIDISSNLLLNWWNNLKTLKFAGFKVQLAFDHLDKVVRAYFGLQVDKSEDELDTKIKSLSAAFEQLTGEMKALKETRECVALAKASKSDIIKDCLTEAATKKWWPAVTGLL
ncbi:unnamed protein product [Dovyalis caffra]|uniref:Uncharacterized protein n=1 Tax=Dovyalis caffra TaxID=77055 RepID=A0AAV1RS32_9ROSI|nr:unnamed protein product [Dovyalis caffra]